nr:DUF4158 domain-containing protein [Streptomyces venezuelae]
MQPFLYLDDADRELVESTRRSHDRLGFAAQRTTVRYLGGCSWTTRPTCRGRSPTTWASIWTSRTPRC